MVSAMALAGRGAARLAQARPRLATRLSRALAAPLLACLAACSTLPPLQAVLGSPPLTGRLVVNVAATPQAIAQSISAGFELSGDASQGQLKLISPIGTQVALARWTPEGAELDTGDGPRRFADLATLSREALGEEVPLAALGDWLAGQPWSGAAAEPTSSGPAGGVPAGGGLAGGFTQLGWQIDLSRYASDALVVAQRAAAPAVTLRAKLDR